ncbi:hypothetical protein [Paenibacillus tianjinensis]|uniref:Uncharacterized protein n=1 Tax=Paenibacillus tianjinensis TaxID=2810347 RepID=A0ABX7L6D4_9BACL|nr:hypothetical protein [Paenibacillus tianjinensis]QSF43281.1 hypothetical protein JRJ22_18615 [Paenibacillus tianjinensis]
MVNIKDISENSAKLQCYKCEKVVVANSANFYSHKNVLVSSSHYPLCKKCINKYLGNDNKSTGYISRVKDILSRLNKPFLSDLWISSNEEWGTYAKNILSLTQYRELTYEDSTKEIISSNVEGKEQDIAIDDELINKWGNGYKAEEYIAFERKHINLKSNYKEKTAMHTESLLIYIRYRVKEEFATSANDFKAAKEWGTLAKDAATAAKINPSQFTKADLTNGVDSFGELVRSVEEAVDVISILPKFKERPLDKVDFTLLCYVNYIRDIQGMEPASYEDIYRFLEERTKEYEEGLDDIPFEGDING